MMQCHQCPHSKAVAAGRYRRVPFEETPCAKCELEENPVFNRSLDDKLPGGLHVEDIPAPAESQSEDTMVPMSVLTDAIALLLSLPATARDVVCWRWCGVSYPVIGRHLGITASAVEKRHRGLMRRRPALRALFAVKASKQKSNNPICAE